MVAYAVDNAVLATFTFKSNPTMNTFFVILLFLAIAGIVLYCVFEELMD